jgi:hypothetical protein
LGSSTRRDPGAADRTYHGWSRRPLKTGTFYFARKRNFLLCLDRRAMWHLAPPVPSLARMDICGGMVKLVYTEALKTLPLFLFS